jgi:HAD superfamily phosphoserine phosphatase-like hydrolase
MAEPLILAFGRGILRDFSGLPDSVLDIIPADYVVNTVLAVAANPPPDTKPRIYHVASGSRNPLRFRRIAEEATRYFGAHPLRDRYGQAIGTPTWTYPTRGELQTRAKTALRFVEAAQWVVERLPLGAGVASVSDDLNDERERLERGLNLIQLYGVYTEVDCIFDTRNLMSMWEKVPPAERKTFPFDPALYDWDHYFQDVHFPTVVRMSRAETVARKGKQPTGSTAAKAESSTVRAAIERRAGRGDVLAVFDVDGTLVETNVVEYFLWMRLRAQPLDDWPAFMAQMLREAPRWLYLERRSRAEFQRSFYREYDGLDYDVMKGLGREALDAVTLRRIYPEGMRQIREHKRAGHRVLLLTGALDVVVEPLAELLDVEVDCAHLLVEDGRMTGDLQSPPPAGEARGTLLEEYAERNGIVLSELRVRGFAVRPADAGAGRDTGRGQPRRAAVAGRRAARLANRALAHGARQLAVANARPALTRVPRGSTAMKSIPSPLQGRGPGRGAESTGPGRGAESKC